MIIHTNMKNYILTALIICHSLSGFAQTKTATLKVTGEVTTPLNLSLADLMAMPQTAISKPDRDGGAHTYTGVSLQDILTKAGATLGGQLRGENLTKYVLVSASDGYQVVFALAEMDKDFLERKLILAEQMDGKPLPDADGPFRIVIQDEKKQARNIKQVTEIKIAFAK